MGFQDQSIKRKTLAVIMLTSVVVLLLTAAAFTVYDLVTYRQNLVHGKLWIKGLNCPAWCKRQKRKHLYIQHA